SGDQPDDRRADLGDVIGGQREQGHRRHARLLGVLNDGDAAGVLDLAQSASAVAAPPQRTTPMARSPHRAATQSTVTSMEGREKFTGGPSVLLDCAFGASERPGDLAEAPLLDEAGQHDALLVARQARDQVGEHGAAIGLWRIAGLAGAGHWLPALARQALPAV